MVVHELRRSVFSGIDEEGLKKTIILNAKSLMERDAGLHKFAGRILLSYIYEEVLDWDIERDGIGSQNLPTTGSKPMLNVVLPSSACRHG